MARRITAAAAMIGLVGAVVAVVAAAPGAGQAAGSAVAARGTRQAAAAGSTVTAPGARQAAVAPGGSIPFSVADPETAPRPVVTVAIGGARLRLLLDTGSTGIRVSADKVPAKAVTVTGPAAPYGYGSGVRLHGDQADTDVTIGGYHTGPLPIELVRFTDCFPDKPNCPAAKGAKPAMFGGVLDGVLGVSPEAAPGLVNPLWALQDPAGNFVGREFAVRYTPAQFSGEVLLNVPAQGYGLVQLPKSGTSWNPRAVQTCVAATGIAKTCAPALFDSGTPNFALDVPDAPVDTLPAGGALEIGVPQVGWSGIFTSGPGSRVTMADAASTTAGGTLLGLPAFAKGPIRFDLVAGTVGFPVPHAAAPYAAPVLETAAPKPPPILPFHKTAKKAARLPETGVSLSAALGAVTALTALTAGIVTVLASRRE